MIGEKRYPKDLAQEKTVRGRGGRLRKKASRPLLETTGK